ncbi:hypothetical protein WN943_002739 [Citrus x changshan-huyou]
MLTANAQCYLPLPKLILPKPVLLAAETQPKLSCCWSCSLLNARAVDLVQLKMKRMEQGLCKGCARAVQGLWSCSSLNARAVDLVQLLLQGLWISFSLRRRNEKEMKKGWKK